MKILEINICRDFSKVLGGGEKEKSENSGQEFRDRFLDGKFEAYDKIIIDLDGVLGFPVDFMEEVFGSLARQHGAAAVREKLELKDRTDFAKNRILYIIDHAG